MTQRPRAAFASVQGTAAEAGLAGSARGADSVAASAPGVSARALLDRLLPPGRVDDPATGSPASAAFAGFPDAAGDFVSAAGVSAGFASAAGVTAVPTVPLPEAVGGGAGGTEDPRDANQAMVTISRTAATPATRSTDLRDREGTGSGTTATASRVASAAWHW